MPDNRPKISDLECSGIFSGDVSLEDFLRDYWQQKPLILRNAFPGFVSPLTPEELAGLACEEDSNARIVIEKAAERPWSVQYGPFDDDTFADLPEDNWTLLVSDVEKHVPAVRHFMDCFRFIPDWRRDDLMISYAPEGGSVGPHLDAYDVFLLQAYGRRNWMISYDHVNRFLQNTDLSILASFTADEQWILEPGDMLYLPPGIAHHGVALEPCMTCSIGFRAPSHRAMLAEYAEHIANTIASEQRYTDPGLQLQSHAAEISQAAMDKVEQILKESLDLNRNSLQRWFGEFLSEPRSGTHSQPPGIGVKNYTELEKLLDIHDFLEHASASKFLFIRDGNAALLFVDGSSFSVSMGCAEALTQHDSLNCNELKNAIISNDDRQLMVELYNRGALFFSDETD